MKAIVSTISLAILLAAAGGPASFAAERHPQARARLHVRAPVSTAPAITGRVATTPINPAGSTPFNPTGSTPVNPAGSTPMVNGMRPVSVGSDCADVTSGPIIDATGNTPTPVTGSTIVTTTGGAPRSGCQPRR